MKLARTSVPNGDKKEVLFHERMDQAREYVKGREGAVLDLVEINTTPLKPLLIQLLNGERPTGRVERIYPRTRSEVQI